ncbi:lytic transglycosylase domain-containing protein [Nisaea acidiphila]|uniref:Lytic transglycosylase domain-containing protein n=1 Tax=Nisaea acidiphila TaxID=1862145 RepID=A0A9J7AVD6_9PROT|nr:lytic transglycosylase domain-containing protein [Nisaea acidiphila]UUX50425.1 lytic transglycosylase domain-containing protein [Nisaea acidiphila]
MLFRYGPNPWAIVAVGGFLLSGLFASLPQVSFATTPVPEIRPGSPDVERPPLPMPRPGDLLVPKNSSTVYRRAFSFAENGKWSAINKLERQPKRPELEKVLLWLRLKDPRAGSGFDELSTFLRANPAWPGRRRLIELAELRMPEDLPAAAQKAWFAEIAPRSAAGRLKYLRSLEGGSDPAPLAEAARAYWHETPFGLSDHRAFLKRYRTLLRTEDHWIRLDRMLWKGYLSSARRVMPLVERDRQKLALARMTLRTQSPGVDGAINRVPDALRSDPGLQYERLRWRHRKGRKDSALELLWSVPAGQDFADLWWRERARQIRYALDDNRTEDAYLLSAAHIQQDGYTFAEAEWHAGWIALRFADKPTEALAAFTRLYDGVSTSISLARAAYWAGRAAEELEDTDKARHWYKRAADNPATFYGQLAQARLSTDAFRLPREPRPTRDARNQFRDSELVRTASALSRLGEDELARDFVLHLSYLADDGPEAVLVARLARELGYLDLAVRAARNAARKGIVLAETGYPTRYATEHGPLEPALMLAIIRQESGFDAEAKSRAGARGLMQLMPATARQVSKTVKQRYSQRRLTDDPYFNITLGRAYLSGLIDRFEGSYVLAIAAYNAGPGNVDRWLRERGDPRSGEVDVIDWIERIPFGETRNYVQRVLEGLIVYRDRLGRHSPVISWDKVSPRDVWCVTACGILIDAHQASAPLGE